MQRSGVSFTWTGARSFLLLLLFFTASACVDAIPDQDLRILSATPVAKMSADILWKEFQDNPRQAERSYWGKVIEITGKVTTVGDGTPTNRYVLFAQSGEQGVRANLLEDAAAEILAGARENPRITLKCFCESSSGNVVLKSCVKP
jgi:hypothetical protein